MSERDPKEIPGSQFEGFARDETDEDILQKQFSSI